MRTSDDCRAGGRKTVCEEHKRNDVLENKMCHNFLTDHREQGISA